MRNDGKPCRDYQTALTEHLEDVEKGQVQPALLALAQPDATCKQGAAALDFALQLDREWALWGVVVPFRPVQTIPVVVDGKVTDLTLQDRIAQLCIRDAVKACKTNGGLAGEVEIVLQSERQKQLQGMPANNSLARPLLATLACEDKLIDQCYAVGDFQPMRDLVTILTTMVEPAGDVLTLEEVQHTRDVINRLEDALTKCARYELTWKSQTHVSVSDTTGHASEVRDTTAEYEATLAYIPLGSTDSQSAGKITGQGPARFDECTDRLTTATDFLSLEILTPCKTDDLFRAEIGRMDFRRSARPARLELRGALPTVLMTWRQCWTGTGCSEHQGVSGGTDMYLAYLHQPEKSTLNDMVIVPNLREGVYPVIFEGTARAHALITRVTFDDVSEIRLEHIGKR